MHGRIVFLVLLLLFTSCDSDSRPSIGRPDGRAEFKFVSSWKPAIEHRGYVTFIDYSFHLRNVGARAGTPTCDILFRRQPLEGWSQGDEIPAGSEGLASGRALLAQDVDPNKILTRLEPRCREARSDEPVTPIERQFFGKEGDQAYFDLRRRGLKVRFGPEVSRAERLNIRGQRSHPEVAIVALEHNPGADIVTIIDVDCVGREVDLC